MNWKFLENKNLLKIVTNFKYKNILATSGNCNLLNIDKYLLNYNKCLLNSNEYLLSINKYLTNANKYLFNSNEYLLNNIFQFNKYLLNDFFKENKIIDKKFTIFGEFNKSKNIILGIIEDQKTINITKQTLILDIDDIKFEKNLSQMLFFNISNYYDIISISNSILENSKVYLDCDPYGCIKQKIFINKKENVNFLGNLKKMIIVSENNDFLIKYNENIILNKNKDIFGILHFLTNLNYQNLTDFRPTIISYKGLDGIEAFEKVQKSLFRQRNLLNGNSFEKAIESINNHKIEEYKKLQNQLTKERRKDYLIETIKGGIMFLKDSIF